MKRSVLLTFALLVAAFILPLLAALGTDGGTGKAPETSAPSGTSTPPVTTSRPAAAGSTPPQSTSAAQTETASPGTRTIAIWRDGLYSEIALEDAVALIVAAEMPALFPAEALRAQAVAARTYLAYRDAHRGTAHPEAAVCNNPGHCCAMAELDSLAAGWGDKSAEYLARIQSAAADTAGLILYYDGAPALTVFHAMSGPETYSAEAVWGNAVPYLTAVDAPAGEALLDRYAESVVYDAAEFRAAFLAKYPSAVLTLGRADWFTQINRTSAGLVRSVTVGGVTVTGSDLRFLCGLRSANFSITQGTGRIQFDTRGYGHGVGMSQNGAKVLALDGMGYADILAYYYPSTVLGAV